jgi:hypothetical protein
MRYESAREIEVEGGKGPRDEEKSKIKNLNSEIRYE